MQEMQAAQHAKEKEAASLELEREKRWLVKQQRQLAERDSARETQSTRLGSRVQAQDTRYARGGGYVCVRARVRVYVCVRMNASFVRVWGAEGLTAAVPLLRAPAAFTCLLDIAAGGGSCRVQIPRICWASSLGCVSDSRKAR